MGNCFWVSKLITIFAPANDPSGLFFVMGLTGFDGEMKWYVSTRWLEGFHHNLSFQQNNWQHTVCSRCLIEAQ